MANLIIKPNSATGDKLIIQDRAGGAVLTTADSGATVANATLNSPTLVTPALGTPASGVVTNLTGTLQGHPSIVLGSAQFVAATGPDGAAGTIDGDYKYHVFTATKTGSAGFVVSAAGNPAGSNTLEYYILAGGGGSDDDWGAGAGAGGCLTNNDMTCPPVGNYDVTVGPGGSRGASAGNTGGVSTFNGLTALGGGPGINNPASNSLRNGGCGGGGQGAAAHLNRDRAGEGKKRPQYQGGDGGFATKPITNVSGSSGGGGIGGNGTDGPIESNGTMVSGAGGPGLADIGAGTERGGGGGGGGYDPRSLGFGTASAGGGAGASSTGAGGANGTANYGGGGGGGAGGGGTSGNGGSGIVIIKYKFQ